MANDALKLIREAENNALQIIDRARIEAAKNISDAKAKATSDLNELEKSLMAEKEQAISAAKELANDKSASIKDTAIAEAGRITESLSANKLSAKNAVLQEITR